MEFARDCGRGDNIATARTYSQIAPLEDEAALLEHLNGLALRNAELEEANRRLRANLERAERLAHLDPLTGLSNRRYFDAAARSELQRAARTRVPLTLFICDVDYFKHCNDVYGHEAGDAVLVRIAEVLRTFCRRGGDLAIRYGGDEFALLLPGVGTRAAARLADGLREAVQRTAIQFGRDGFLRQITLTIGSATFRGAPACPTTDLVNAADRALYRAKRDGRNRTALVVCGPPAAGG
jgi:two-component system, chemotaxis family, response regulator WspR